MKRDREGNDEEEQEKKYSHLIPRWYHEISEYSRGKRGTEWRPAFHDDSWEWDRPVYQDDTHNRPRKTENRAYPLGVFVKREYHGFMAEFLFTRPDVSIVDPCAWFGKWETPLELALSCGAAFFEPYMIGIFWTEGLSISHITSSIHASGCDHYDEYEKEIEQCVASEDAIMAMVWCCARVARNTQWPDISEVTAVRMRRDCPVKVTVFSTERGGVYHVGNMDTK